MIVAMMALFGSVAHAPLAVMLMVAEMTDSLAMLGPAMLAIGVATLVVGDRSMYASQLRSRADSPAHRFRFALPLMASIPAGDAVRAPRAVLRTTDTRRRPPATGSSRRRAGRAGRRPRRRRARQRRPGDLMSADPAPTVGDLRSTAPSSRRDDALDDVLAALADAHRVVGPGRRR